MRRAEVEGENVGERVVSLAALGEGLGHVARRRDLEPPVVAQEDVHGLAERAGSEEAYSAIGAPKFDSYSDK